jgi:predicted nucleic acid-binding protein
MVIVDTNVVSEIMRPVPEPTVVRWFSSQANQELHSTAITVAEILFGIELLPAGKRREALRAGAEKMFGVALAGQILPFEDRAARAFSAIASSRHRQGRPISKLDAQIAAIARANHATLATRNTDDFEGCGVLVVNPWEG